MSNQHIPPAARRPRSSAATPSAATLFDAALANAATHPTLFRPAATDRVLWVYLSVENHALRLVGRVLPPRYVCHV